MKNNKTPIPKDELHQIIGINPILVENRRRELARVIQRRDDRLLVKAGECAIRTIQEHTDNLKHLESLKQEYEDEILFEKRLHCYKPRTTSTGFKGIGFNPTLDPNIVNIADGILRVRELGQISQEYEIGLTEEILSPKITDFNIDMYANLNVGARSTLYQPLREHISSLTNIPVGMKNPTDGDLKDLINSLIAVNSPQEYLDETTGEIVKTKGCNLAYGILRGGKNGANLYENDLLRLYDMLHQNDSIKNKVVTIDLSHDNCLDIKTGSKNPSFQIRNLELVLESMAKHPHINDMVIGFEFESDIYAGKQEHTDKLKYGYSITDPCISQQSLKNCVSKISQYTIERREGTRISTANPQRLTA